MSAYTSARSMVLIATDVAARGIDVEGINCVIHYDPPDDAKVYKHRSGRTARAGSRGVVISLVKGNEKRRYDKIQKEVGIKKRFTDPHPDDLEKKEFKLVEPRSKRVKNKHRQSPRKGNSQNGNENRSRRPDYSKKGKRKKRFEKKNDSPRNWGEKKNNRGRKKNDRHQRKNNRGFERRRSKR